jgi:hypothetical protein
VEPRWDVVFLLRLDGLAPTCWQSLGGLKELMQCARQVRTGPRHGGYKRSSHLSRRRDFLAEQESKLEALFLSNRHLKALYAGVLNGCIAAKAG